MKESKRLKTLCSQLERCELFADVGCDHGYCTEYMLEHNLCDRAVISDISAESLKKAETLLGAYMRAGRVCSVCCNGLERVPKECDFVLIAGMGGEEIISILEKGFLPPKLLLQPMKNTERVRRYLHSRHMKIVRDYTFQDGKFYDVIKAERGEEIPYSDSEYEYGRGNLAAPSADFLCKLEGEIEKIIGYLQENMSQENRERLCAELAKRREVYDAAQRNLRNTR